MSERKRHSSTSCEELSEESRPYLINHSQHSVLDQKKIVISSDEFLVGRSMKASLNILHPTISRTHCIIRKALEDAPWTLVQLGSSPSWINALQLSQGESMQLKNGDLVEFNDERAFSFKFYLPVTNKDSKRTKNELKEEQVRMMEEKEDLELKMKEKIQLLELQYLKKKEELEKTIQNENLEKQKLAEERALIEEKLAQEKLMAEKKFNDEKKSLEKKLKELEETVKKIEEEKRLKEEEAKKILQEESEKIKASLAKKEDILKKRLEEDIASLTKEKENIEATMQTELLKKDGEYEENIKKMAQELEKVKQDLKQNMNKKSLLEKQLEETAGSSYLQAKNELLESFGEVIESELQCSICNELYVEAMTLNCMHTFCRHCLNIWKKRKKECPICRAKIKTENRAFFWDSFIDKMVEKLTEEMRARRKALVAERAGGKKSKNTVKNVPVVTIPATSLNGAAVGVSGQRIRIAVPISAAQSISSTGRAPYIPSVRVLGSIDLTRGNSTSPSTTQLTLQYPLRSVPSNSIAGTNPSVIISRVSNNTLLSIPNSNASTSAPRNITSSTSSSSSTPRRRSLRRSKRKRVPNLNRVAREEVVDIVNDELQNARPPRIDDSVIVIPDEPSPPPAQNGDDSDSSDIVLADVSSLRKSLNKSSASINDSRAMDISAPSSSNSRVEDISLPSTSHGSSRLSQKRKFSARRPVELSTSSSDDDSSVEGYFDYEYSGGRCWDCGKRGHWARACPFNKNE